jgi:putative hydrolase of the HAD superfamily
MAMRAVIFDFYGTLSVGATAAARRAGAARIADALGIPAARLHEAIAATFTERATGVCGDLEQTMSWLAARCETSPNADQLAQACAIRRETEEIYARALRDDAVPTLQTLQELDIKIGLLSDCTHELPDIWPTLPVAPFVDASVFSVVTGLRKPDPQMYESVISALGVAPNDCLYVGDGGSGELTGANRAGMTALRLVTPDGQHSIVYDADTEWSGDSITSLGEVLNYCR